MHGLYKNQSQRFALFKHSFTRFTYTLAVGIFELTRVGVVLFVRLDKVNVAHARLRLHFVPEGDLLATVLNIGSKAVLPRLLL